MYNPLMDKVTLRRDVVFREHSRWDWNANTNSKSMHVQDDMLLCELDNEAQSSSGGHSMDTCDFEEQKEAQQPQFTVEGVAQASTELGEASDDESPPRRTRQLSDTYNNCSFALHVADPITYEDIAKSNEWQEAMREEMNSSHSTE